MFLAAMAILVAVFVGWQRIARLRLKREIGSLDLLRDIFFCEDVVVDIANKEILLEGKWYPPKQIHHWNTASGRGLLGSTPHLTVRIQRPRVAHLLLQHLGAQDTSQATGGPPDHRLVTFG